MDVLQLSLSVYVSVAGLLRYLKHLVKGENRERL